MASRRDELNAYSFARKRTVASFLRPLPNGSMESAPRPVRTILPSVVLGMVILIGFGACGLIKPAAPVGWNKAGTNVIVGDESTTRYVVLTTGEKDADGHAKTELHPVLNFASARLLLSKDKYEVVKVKESVLDGPKAPPRGATIGIPYAPDRLPSKEDAQAKKTWAICEQPGVNGTKSQRSVFVFSSKDPHRKRITGAGQGKLDDSKAMYVQDPDGKEYLVDYRGVAQRLDAFFAAGNGQVSPQDKERLTRLLPSILFGQMAQPQKVSKEWMKTLIPSDLPIFFPPVPDVAGQSTAEGAPQKHRKVGEVLEADGAYYVVLKDRVAPITDFVAKLLLEGPVGLAVYGQDGNAEPAHLSLAQFTPDKDPWMTKIPFPGQEQQIPWPEKKIEQANTTDAEQGSKVACSVYYGGNRTYVGQSLGVPNMSMWVGSRFPVAFSNGGSAYVTPGSGLLYKQVKGNSSEGSTFLLTDTGLRYYVPANNDSSSRPGKAEDDKNKAQIRLGYGSISSPPTVPEAWSELLAAGPSLNTRDAERAQGS